MAHSTYRSTPQTTNAARVSRVIMGPCTDVFREALRHHISESDFPLKLASYKNNVKPRLKGPQRDMLYPSNASCTAKYKDFDISLLYLLIRNMCGIPAHGNGWGNQPASTDRSLSANLDRIREIRNTYCGHSPLVCLSDSEFLQVWSDIRQAVLEIEFQIIGRSTHFTKEIDILKAETMDPEQERMYLDIIDEQQEQLATIVYLLKTADVNNVNKIETTEKMAQDIMMCDLCELMPLQMHCNRCDKSMCQDCVTKHISSDTSVTHEVVIFKMKNEEPVFPYCESHKKKCEMYCHDDNIAICPRCFNDHNVHLCEDIVKVYDSLENSLKEDTEALEQNIYTEYHNKRDEAKCNLKNISQNSERLISAFEKQRYTFHDEIDRVVKELTEKVKTNSIKNSEKIENHLLQIENVLSDIDQTISTNKKILRSKKFTTVVKYTPKLVKFNKPPSVVLKPTYSIFSPKPIQGKEVNYMFGTLIEPMDDTDTACASDRIFRKNSILYTTYKPLWNVACLNQTEIWISGNDSKIKLFKTDGSLKDKVITRTGAAPGCIAVTPEGFLVYSDASDRTINVYKNGQIETIITLRDWEPDKICCKKAGTLLVSMHKEGSSSRLVHYQLLTTKIIQSDDKGNPLFSPGVLHIDMNVMENEYCISDRLARSVILVNEEGKQKFTYTGHTTSPKRKLFDPCGIAIDNYDQILIADFGNECIHIIDQDGFFLGYLGVNHLHKPYCLSQDNNDTLYVVEHEKSIVKLLQNKKLESGSFVLKMLFISFVFCIFNVPYNEEAVSESVFLFMLVWIVIQCIFRSIWVLLEGIVKLFQYKKSESFSFVWTLLTSFVLGIPDLFIPKRYWYSPIIMFLLRWWHVESELFFILYILDAILIRIHRKKSENLLFVWSTPLISFLLLFFFIIILTAVNYKPY